jgi:hypothetical protein
MFNGERSREMEQVYEDFKVKGFHIKPGLITSTKIVPGYNAGNVLFGELYEVPMTSEESFRNSKLGQVVERIIYRSSR